MVSSALIILILAQKLLEIPLLNNQRLHASLTSCRPLRSSRGQPSLIFLFILLENGAEGLVVQVVALHALDHRLQIQRQLELSLDYLHQSTLVDHAGFIGTTAQSDESVHYI